MDKIVQFPESAMVSFGFSSTPGGHASDLQEQLIEDLKELKKNVIGEYKGLLCYLSENITQY